MYVHRLLRNSPTDSCDFFKLKENTLDFPFGLVPFKIQFLNLISNQLIEVGDFLVKCFKYYVCVTKLLYIKLLFLYAVQLTFFIIL